MTAIATSIKNFFLGDLHLDELEPLDEPRSLNEIHHQSDTESDRIMMVEEELASVVQAISQERRQLQAIFDAMPQCIYVADIKTGEIYYSNPAINRAALSEDGPEGLKCYEFLHGSKHRCPDCPAARLLDGEYPIHREVHNCRMGIDFKVTDTLIDWPGRGKAKLQVATDITLIKEAQRQVQRRTYELEALAEASYEAIAVHRNNQMIISNKAFQDLTGYSAEELIAMDDLIGTLFPSEKEEVRRRVVSYDTSVYRTKIETKSGETKDIIVKPNYVPFNHTGECRCAAIVTHEYMKEREQVR